MRKIKLYLLLAALIITYNSCIINGIHGQANTAIDQAEDKFENVTSLIIKGSFCNVNIDTHSLSGVAFKGEVKANKERDDIKIKYHQNGTVLEVWIEKPTRLQGSFDGVLEFKVPSNTNIEAENTSGSIYVDNLGQGVIKLTASSGSIHTKNINSDLSAKTSSGSIKINNISGNVNCTSSSGSITINEGLGNVISKSASGSQQHQNITGDINGAASSGSIHIVNAHGNIEGVTSSGTIKVNNIKGALQLTSSSGEQQGKEVLLTTNSSFNSTSGNIKIELKNAHEDLSFKLSASSGALHAKGNKGKKNLQIDKGPILIKGVSTSGNQDYY